MTCPCCGSNPCKDGCELNKQIKWILYEASPKEIESRLKHELTGTSLEGIKKQMDRKEIEK